MPCSPSGDLPNPGMETASPLSPALAGGFFTTSATWEAYVLLTSLYSSSQKQPLVAIQYIHSCFPMLQWTYAHTHMPTFFFFCRTRINSDLNDGGLLFASDRNSTLTILGKKKNSLAEECKPQDSFPLSLSPPASSTRRNSGYQHPQASHMSVDPSAFSSKWDTPKKYFGCKQHKTQLSTT